MRILIVHNFYKVRGGEDAVVESEIDLLKRHGNEVYTLYRSNNDIKNYTSIRLFLNTMWSRKTYKSIYKIIEQIKPDLIHAHNTHPLVSPSIYWAASKRKIPVVQTLHNYRQMCLNALLLRDGKICEECIGKMPTKGVINACYRSSYTASFTLASMLVFHKLLGTYENKITRYIALSEFSKKKYILAGLPQEKILVKPNFVDDKNTIIKKQSEKIIYVGRFSQEKGIFVLLEAMKYAKGVTLRVIGEGHQEEINNNSEVICLGKLPNKMVMKEMGNALALIVPSICYENFPRTIVEAFSCSLPVIASRIGALENIIQNGKTGLFFEPDDPSDLAKKIKWATSNADLMWIMGKNARKKYEEEYSPETNYQQLINIYREAIYSNKHNYR
ncbi:MAG: glycosyltransferase family 4 protein [Candidatus Thiodiazotropha endolucinida]